MELGPFEVLTARAFSWLLLVCLLTRRGRQQWRSECALCSARILYAACVCVLLGAYRAGPLAMSLRSHRRPHCRLPLCFSAAAATRHRMTTATLAPPSADGPAPAVAPPLGSGAACRNPYSVVYPCPLLPQQTLLHANEAAHGYAGGTIDSLVRRRTKAHAAIVDCPCVWCCPCAKHERYRARAMQRRDAAVARASEAEQSDPNAVAAAQARQAWAAPPVGSTRPLLVGDAALPPELDTEFIVEREIGSGQWRGRIASHANRR